MPIDETVTNAIKYCLEHGILTDFLRKHGSEVVNMLFEDLTIEEIAEIRAEEAREDGIEQGISQGREVRDKEIASNLIAEGSTSEFIQKVTGLSLEKIEKLKG